MARPADDTGMKVAMYSLRHPKINIINYIYTLVRHDEAVGKDRTKIRRWLEDVCDRDLLPGDPRMKEINLSDE